MQYANPPPLPLSIAPATTLRAMWLGIGIGTLFAIIVFAPAAWLASSVHRATSGHVVLADAQGSVWRGSAQFFLTGGEGTQDASSLPSRMNWQLTPSFYGLNVRLEMPCCTQQPVHIRLSPGWKRVGLLVNASAVNLPAHWLTGLGAPWNTLDPRGQLAFSATALQMDWTLERISIRGAAQLDLLDISSRLSTLNPLGDYRLQLTGGEVPTINLQTLQGALQLSGSGQVVGTRIRFTGEASAAKGSEEALSNVLGIIGRRQGAKSLIQLG